MKALLAFLTGLLIGAGVVTYYMPAHKYQGKTAEKWAEEAEINKDLYQVEQKRAFACAEDPSSAACNPYFNGWIPSDRIKLWCQRSIPKLNCVEAEYSPTPTPTI
jgi:hypothetical protein